MENGNKPAFSVTVKDNGNASHPVAMGLTKREYFAAIAMQGYIVERRAQDDTFGRKVAEWSVKMADELLKALDNGTEKNI